MRRGKIKHIGITIVIIVIIALGYIGVKKMFSPFQTEEQMQVKELYSKAFKNTNNFMLLRVNPDIMESRLDFKLKLRWIERNQNFSDNDLLDMNLIVEQMIDYLNGVDNLNNIYKDIQLKFYVGQGNNPEYILFIISNSDNGYYFERICSKHCNSLNDFYMMTNATYISIYGGNEVVYDEKKIDKLSNLKKLRKIKYNAKIDGDYLYLLKKKLQIILPECKLYEGDKEIVIE